VFARFPRRPYCYAHKADKPRVRTLDKARSYPYIQPNCPAFTALLPFDLDRERAAVAWDEVDAPRPTAIIARRDRDNSAHYLYALSIPIKHSDCDTDSASERYAAAVELALARKLGADLAFSGSRVKTPDHSAWRTFYCHKLYTLDDLAEYLDLPRVRTMRSVLRTGLGRNVWLFDSTRFWAYETIASLPGAPDITTSAWRGMVERKASGFNGDLPVPLAFPEVRHTSKSIADYTLSRERAFRAALSARQAARGRLSGARRAATADKLKEKARSLRYEI